MVNYFVYILSMLVNHVQFLKYCFLLKRECDYGMQNMNIQCGRENY
jgi:hypothetical protein